METKPANISLLTIETISDNFQIVSKELDKFDAISKAVDIKDDETLAIAENNAAQIKTMMIRTEATRKALKDPYMKNGKAIDSYAKGVIDKLDAFSKRFSLNISTWRSVQEAHKRAELVAKQKELQIIEEEKTAETDRLLRLTNTINAKLYGGVYHTKAGEKQSNGCHTNEACERLLSALKTSFPPASEFKHFPEERDKVFELGMKAIRNHSVNLIELQSQIPKIREIITQKIIDNKKAAGLYIEEKKVKMDKKIALATRKEVSEGEKEIKNAAKGTRKILKFNVVNDDIITREYLSVDTAKIREWMEGKNDEIKAELKTGKQPIAGVEFYVEVTHVAK